MPSNDCEEIKNMAEKDGEKKCIIRLVKLDQLVDKPKAWVKEALSKSEPNIVVLDSDSDNDTTKKTKPESRSSSTDDSVSKIKSNLKQKKDDAMKKSLRRRKVRLKSSSSEEDSQESETSLDSDEKNSVSNTNKQQKQTKDNVKKKCRKVRFRSSSSSDSSEESETSLDSDKNGSVSKTKTNLKQQKQTKIAKKISSDDSQSSDEDSQSNASHVPKNSRYSQKIMDLLKNFRDCKVCLDRINENDFSTRKTLVNNLSVKISKNKLSSKSLVNNSDDSSDENQNGTLSDPKNDKPSATSDHSGQPLRPRKNRIASSSSESSTMADSDKNMDDNNEEEFLLTSDEEDKSETSETKSTKTVKKSKNASGKVKFADSPQFINTSDSEDDFVPAKKTKRKRSVSIESNEEKKETESKKKVRKRIKKVANDDSDSDEEKNKTRKKIRNVLKDGSLSETTKEAAKEEQERIRRIEERQKIYNELYISKNSGSVALEKIVLDFNPDTKEEILSVHEVLVEKLKPHQAKGVQFMWNSCFETVEQSKTDKGSGCILAHCMGLGKTLQVITLVHTLLTNECTGVKKVLVVCPLGTVLNWVNEFRMWLKDVNDGDDVNLYELSKAKKMFERAYEVNDWHECGGVLVIGYEMYRNLTNTSNKLIRKKMSQTFQKGLVDPGPDLVICDEGHLLKNEKSRLSVSMNKIKTLRRVVLTGTPLQNNLKEYYCMIQFVKPNLLGTYKEYTNRFVNPITNGQYTDSTPHDIAVMKRRSHVLHKMLDGIVQRRDYSVLAPYLPPKHEFVISIRLTDIQIKLYEIYMEKLARQSNGGRAVALFSDFQQLQRIWTHPRMLRAYSDKYEQDQDKKALYESDSEGSLRDFIVDETDDSSSNNSSSDQESDKPVRKRVTRSTAPEDREQEEEVQEVKEKNPTEWWCEHVEEKMLEDVQFSGKLLILLDILKKSEAIGDKVLVFSQSLYSLDMIEYFLDKIDQAQSDEEVKLVGGHSASWALGADYFRLDGSSSIENRSAWCKSFNDEKNIRARLFLISTRAGGLGINLVAANRVVIFDVSWNPSHDIQSIFRVYRFGQKKPCYIYRFIAMGTMEEKVYERQVTKLAISKRVIDEQQIDRHYNQNDLNELYKFCPVPEEERPIPNLPKDRLFAEVLQERDNLVYKYHEHDSLLENKEEEELNEEERKQAWLEFENEKQRPSYSMTPQFNGQRPLLSMNETAFILEVMLRHENPLFNDEQIKQNVPSLLQQMYQQMASGNAILYERLLLYRQKIQEQYALFAAAGNANAFPFHPGIPQGTAAPNPPPQRNLNPNDVVTID